MAVQYLPDGSVKVTTATWEALQDKVRWLECLEEIIGQMDFQDYVWEEAGKLYWRLNG